MFCVLKDGWIASAQFPRVEERRPVDEWHEFGKRKIVERTRAKEFRLRNVRAVPIELRPALACVLDTDQFYLLACVCGAGAFVVAAQLLHESRFQFSTDETAHNRNSATRIQNVN